MPDENKISKIIKRWEKLSADKSHWHRHYEDLARVMLPRRVGFTTTVIPGERRTDDIYDGTPMQAARGLANAIGGLLRPEGRMLQDISVNDAQVDASDEAQDWLQDSKNRVLDAINNPKARFRQSTGEIDHDLVVFGTGVMFEGESRKRNSLLFQSVHLKDATPFFDEEGSAEGMFRKRRLPLRQVASMFGEDKLSTKSKEMMQRPNGQDDEIDILHCVLPREEGRRDALFSTNLPYADLWIELDAKSQLSSGGYHEFPFIVPRWDTSSGETMGRSPGMIALPDADTLQAMGETVLIAGQRAADPPLAVPNDGTFNAINTFPGGLAYYDVETAATVRGNPFFPIESATNLPISRDMQGDTRNQVFAAFFRNVLNLPVEGPEMTATEVIQRKEEFIREIGPVFGRLESDYTAPMIERAFMIMLRAGAFLPIPPIMQGRRLIFEYESPVKRIGQQVDAAAARLWAIEMIEFSQVQPAVLDNVNFDGLARFAHDALALPRQVINGTEEVMALREQRAQAEAEQAETEAAAQMLEMGQQAAEIDKGVTKSIGQMAKAAQDAQEVPGG